MTLMSEHSESTAATLARIDIFDNLTPAQYELLAFLCQPLEPRKGTWLLREQEEGDDLYVIVQGGVEVVMDPGLVVPGREGAPGERVVTELRDGQVFGEIALVDQGLRSASVRVSRDDTRLLRISGGRLLMLCDTYPGLGYHVMRNLASELALKLRENGLSFREYQLALSAAPRKGEIDAA
jgi:CRP-like cAMP-binding protein